MGVYPCKSGLMIQNTIPGTGKRLTLYPGAGLTEDELQDIDRRHRELITLKARDSLDPTNIWYHLGDYSEDSDTFDTQLFYFEQQLELFWATIIGPGKYLQSRLLNCLEDFNLDWQSITIDSDHTITMTHTPPKNW